MTAILATLLLAAWCSAGLAAWLAYDRKKERKNADALLAALGCAEADLLRERLNLRNAEAERDNAKAELARRNESTVNVPLVRLSTPKRVPGVAR